MGNSTDNELPRFLEERMAVLGMSKAELARAADVDASQISKWLAGTQPQVKFLRQLAPVLQVPLLKLLVKAGHITEDEAGLPSRNPENDHKAIVDLVTEVYSDQERLRGLILDMVKFAQEQMVAGAPITTAQADEAERRARGRTSSKSARPPKQ